MNERIKQLAKEAGFNLPNNLVEGVNGPGVVTEKDKLTKFAELLVQECCNRLSEETIRHDGYGYNQHELYNRLRKHFGVAE